MKPSSLSATAVLAYMQCPSMFNAQYVLRARDESGTAAHLGSACHEVFELWVKDGYYRNSYSDKKLRDSAAKVLWDQAYWALFHDDDRYEEGWKLVVDWLDRQNWTNRMVLSTEERHQYPLPLPDGSTVPFTYIMDRLDALLVQPDVYEVIDYKSLIKPVQPDQLKGKPQVRIYALMVQIMYPNAKAIWVTFDMLRYTPVSVKFTRDDNVETWRWLKDMAATIFADEPKIDNNGDQVGIWPAEQIGEGCRYCIRKSVCVTFAKHAEVGGPKAMDLRGAMEQIVRIDGWMAGAKALREEAAKVVEAELGRLDEPSAIIDGYEVKASISGKRAVDPQVIRGIIGDERFAAWGNITVGNVDKLLKADTTLTDEEKARVRQSMHMSWGNTSITVIAPTSMP
jgi:PD-(D/E)XK nuclease superfamily protein